MTSVLDDVPPFADVYRAAGITDPPHGFTAFKILEILSSPEFSALPAAAKAGALTGFLKMNPTGPVPLAEIIQDAVRRDQALDRFDEFLRGKLAERASAFDRENARLQSEIDELVRSHRERIEAQPTDARRRARPVRRMADPQARRGNPTGRSGGAVRRRQPDLVVVRW